MSAPWYMESNDEPDGFIPNGSPNEREDIPPWLMPHKVDELSDVMPAVLVDGMICQGDHVLVQGASKMRKTWFLMQMLYCLINGLPFLDFKTNTVQGIHADLELREYFCRRRLEKLKEKIGKGNFDNIRIIPLRGKAHKLNNVRIKQLGEIIREGGAKFFSIDPLYRLLMGLDENSNTQINQLFQPFDELSADTGAAFLAIHHYAKGNAAGKQAIDRAAGAGVFGRAPDVIISLTPHNEPHCLAVEIIQRNFPEIEPFVITWDQWLFNRVDQLNPADLKHPIKGGRPKGDAEERILTALRTAECIAGLPSLTVEDISKATGVPRRTVYDRIGKMRGQIVKAPLTKGFQLSVNERQKFDRASENGEEAP